MTEKSKPSIGGEALLEGVMMRGKSNMAIAIRKPDGEIVVERQQLNTLSQRFSIAKVPIIRGAISMVESMVIGIKAIMYSAEFVDVEEEPPKGGAFRIDGPDGDAVQEEAPENDTAKSHGKKPEKAKKDGGINEGWLVVSVIVALIIGIGLFMVIPYLISRLPLWLFADTAGFAASVTFMNLTEGVIRIALFILYIMLITRIKDVKRVFQYHGAEHKTIYAYEKGDELTVENARKYTTRHPRCGTAFLFIVMIVSIFLFSVLVAKAWWLNVLLRIVLIPVIAGISYEIIKWAGKSDSRLMKIVSWPGMAMQRFTTQEPDDGMLEVAIAALKNVLYTEEELAAMEPPKTGPDEATAEISAEARPSGQAD